MGAGRTHFAVALFCSLSVICICFRGRLSQHWCMRVIGAEIVGIAERRVFEDSVQTSLLPVVRDASTSSILHVSSMHRCCRFGGC